MSDDQKSQGAGMDTGSMLEKVEARKKKLDPELDEQNKPDRPKITSTFVWNCFRSNERGDGSLYAALHQDELFHNKTTGEWFLWTGHFYQRDNYDMAKDKVESVANCYLDESDKIRSVISKAKADGDKEKLTEAHIKEKKVLRRVKRLRTIRGRENCLAFSHTIGGGIGRINEELNLNHWLLACKNGVIDLRTGELRPGRPDDLISKTSSVEFTGIETPAPTWDLFLRQIYQDHIPLVDYTSRVFGYGITGLIVEHFLPILWGQGRNGKGVLVETISNILGDYMAPIQSEMLLDQGHVRSSAGPSPDILGLHGLRIAFASETDAGRRFSTSKVKWLTGGDTLKGRNAYDKHATVFYPTHTLFLMTNSKPAVADDDFAFWERVHLIPFELSFVDRDPEKANERPADKYLQQRLLKEGPGILAWLVRGCLEWQRIGLSPPPVVIDATREYRRDEDMLGHFLKDCCYEDPGTESTAKELYDRFREWWQINVSRKVLSQKKFGGMMVKRFKRSKSGTYRYFGIGLLPDWAGN